MLQDRIELGDEHVRVRRLVQDQPGLPGIHRAPGRQFLVKCAHPGPDRIAAGQAARQPVTIRTSGASYTPSSVNIAATAPGSRLTAPAYMYRSKISLCVRVT